MGRSGHTCSLVAFCLLHSSLTATSTNKECICPKHNRTVDPNTCWEWYFIKNCLFHTWRFRLSRHSMVSKFLTSSPPGSSSYTLVRCVYCSRNPHAVHTSTCSLASSDMETGLWYGAHDDVGASVLFTTWGHRLCEEYTRADDETGIWPRSLTDKASPSAPPPPPAKPKPTYDLNLPPRLTDWWTLYART